MVTSIKIGLACVSSIIFVLLLVKFSSNKVNEETYMTINEKQCVGSESLPCPKVQWRPDPADIINWTNRAPFHHMPGKTMTRVGADGLKRLLDPKNCRCPPKNVAVLYINTKYQEMTSLLEETMTKCKCTETLFRVGGNHTGHMEWHRKPEYLLDFLSSHSLRFDYLIFMDAFDVALVGDASDIISRFEKYQADMVTCNTERNIPAYMKKEGHFEEWVYPWSRHHFYLNSGGIMVRTDKFGFYLERMMEGYQRSIDKSLNVMPFTDQGELKMLHLRYYPKIKVDSLSWIFTKRNYYLNVL